MANKLADSLSDCHVSLAIGAFDIAKPNGKADYAGAPTCCASKRTRLNSLSDEEVMILIQAGDHDAFANLFDRYFRLVLSIALKILRNDAEAEDMMQEVFFEVYRRAEEFDATKGTTKFWIMRYAYSRTLNRLAYLGRRRFYDPRSNSDLEAIEPSYEISSWNGLSMQEWRIVLEKGLAMMSQKQRETVERVCYKGQSMSEIAVVLNETVGNVRNHYYRGIKKLREYLQGQSCLEETNARSCAATINIES